MPFAESEELSTTSEAAGIGHGYPEAVRLPRPHGGPLSTTCARSCSNLLAEFQTPISRGYGRVYRARNASYAGQPDPSAGNEFDIRSSPVGSRRFSELPFEGF